MLENHTPISKLPYEDWEAGLLPCVLSVMSGEEPSLFVAMRMSLSNKLSSTRAPTSSKRVTAIKRKIIACKFRCKPICPALRTRFSKHYPVEKITQKNRCNNYFTGGWTPLQIRKKRNKTKQNTVYISSYGSLTTNICSLFEFLKAGFKCFWNPLHRSKMVHTFDRMFKNDALGVIKAP